VIAVVNYVIAARPSLLNFVIADIPAPVVAEVGYLLAREAGVRVESLFLRGAKFSGGRVYFLAAKFPAGMANLRWAKFPGGIIHFRNAEFN
jgi:hypothetical protein